MFTVHDYRLTLARWQTAAATLTERDFQILLEFGNCASAALPSEADRARRDRMAAITKSAPPSPPQLKFTTAEYAEALKQWGDDPAALSARQTQVLKVCNRKPVTRGTLMGFVESLAASIAKVVKDERDHTAARIAELDVRVQTRDEQVKALELRIRDSESRIVELEATIAAREPV